MWSVYLLQSEHDGRFYIGIAQDVQRLKRHNSGWVRCTKGRRPLHLVGSREFDSFSEARNAEVQLKAFKNPARVLQWMKD